MSRCPVVKAGQALPELSRPAGSNDIRAGYQAISRDGEIITGAAVIKDWAQIVFKNTTARDFKIFYDSGSVTVSGGSERLVSIAVPQVVTTFHQGYFSATGGINRIAYGIGKGAYANYDVSILRVSGAGTATV